MQTGENESIIRFSGTLPTVRLSVASKTWLSLTLLFWIPFSILMTLLFLFLRDSREEERIERLRHDLRTSRTLQQQLVDVLRIRLERDAGSLGVLFRDRNGPALQRTLSGLAGKGAGSLIPFMIAVDASRHVLARSADGAVGDEIRIGDVLSDALVRGEERSSFELVENAVLSREGVTIRQETGDHALVRFLVLPVRSGERVVGALIAGIPLTGSSDIPNRILQEYDTELGLFAGGTPTAALLHSASSLPRSIWTPGQALPEALKEPIYLNQPFVGMFDLSGFRYAAAADPVVDSRGAVIGALVAAHPAPLFEGGVLRRLVWAVLVGALLGFVPAVVITYLIQRDITGPIAAMTKALDRFARGDTHVRLNFATGDEFEEMGRGFNHMADDITLREERLRKHYEVAHLLMGSLRLDELLERVLRIAIDVTQSVVGIIYLYNEEEETLIPEAVWGASSDVPPLKKGQGLPGRAAAERRSILINLNDESEWDVTSGDMPAPDPGTGPIPLREGAFIPFIYQDRLLGVLMLGSLRGYEGEDRRLFDYLANQIAIALDNALLHSKVHELSVTDHLTGLYNRRYIHDRMQKEWAGSIRHNRPISVILGDVDNFKRINDQMGHDRGDDVLSAVASVLKAAARKEDLVSRFGGEEFILALPDTAVEGALQLAERLRAGIESLRLPVPGGTVTMSFGVACFPDYRPSSYEELFWAADQAMYHAKTSGKNRVVLYEP